MGRSENGSDAYPAGDANEVPEHLVNIKSFYLDKYEVTTARFSRFVLAFDSWRKAGNPTKDMGASPNLTGSGWQPDVDSTYLSARAESLVSSITICIAGSGGASAIDVDNLVPRNCVDWLEARAFCAWDGGWLPTEAEWEFAAAGGDEDRLYPWGNAAPSFADNATYNLCEKCLPPQVGLRPAGDGRYGHADLAGGLSEWVMGDGDALYSADPCLANCGVVPGALGTPVVRGGDYVITYDYQIPQMRAAARRSVGSRYPLQGFRCARAQPQ